MTEQLVTVWSAAQERTGTAQFALTSPLIGSTARMCMALGSHANAEGPRVKDQPRKTSVKSALRQVGLSHNGTRTPLLGGEACAPHHEPPMKESYGDA